MRDKFDAVSFRPTPDPEVVPLLRAIKARIEGLGPVTNSPKDGSEVYYRNKTAFLQLEIRRDHMSLDLWLPRAQLEEARASGIARAHPFLGDDAVKVRFERAGDLSRIARWIESSYAYAPDRARRIARKKASPKPVVKTSPLIKPMAPSASSPMRGARSGPRPPAPPKKGSMAAVAGTPAPSTPPHLDGAAKAAPKRATSGRSSPKTDGPSRARPTAKSTPARGGSKK